MHGSVSVQGAGLCRWSVGPITSTVVFLLRRASVHSLSTSSWKRSSAMGTLNARSLLRCCATASRKKEQVRNSASRVCLLVFSAEVMASCSSHDAGRPSSEMGVAGGPVVVVVAMVGKQSVLRALWCAS